MTAIISLTDGVKRNQSIATAYELTLFQSTNPPIYNTQIHPSAPLFRLDSLALLGELLLLHVRGLGLRLVALDEERAEKVRYWVEKSDLNQRKSTGCDAH